MITGATAQPTVKMTMVIHHKESGLSFNSPEEFNSFLWKFKFNKIINKIKGIF